MRLLSSLIVTLLFTTPALAAVPCDGLGHGKLLIQGGGGAPQTYANTGLDLCGGQSAKVVLIERAFGELRSSNPGDVAYATSRWLEAGAKYVSVLDFLDEDGAIAAISAADYIFFDGGDQKMLVEWMDKHPVVMGAIRARHAAGALVGGMSAGAAAMPTYMIRGLETADLAALQSRGTLILPGLGFWPEVITDQHFVKRQRWARLVSAVLDNPKLPGVAINEETAVIVDREAGTLKVIGNGVVMFFDARGAKIAPTVKGENWSADGLRLTVLRAGDCFDWKRGRKLR